MEIFFGVLLFLLVLGGGGALTGYLTVECDSILAVLASFLATIILASIIGIGCIATACEADDQTCYKQVEQTQQHEHVHCPYCNAVID